MCTTNSAFEKNEKILLCLTSISHRRFIEDLVHVVGMPKGTHLRLRYRRRYVETAFWDDIFKGRPGSKYSVLISLVGLNSAEEADAVPLRKAKVFNIACEGGLLVLDVVLDDFIYQSNDFSLFFKELKLGAKSVPGNVALGGQAVFVQTINYDFTSLKFSDSVFAWEKVAEAFFRIDKKNEKTELGIAPFLYFVSNFPEKIQSSLAKTGALTLAMGPTYSIDIHTITRENRSPIINALGEVALELSHPAATFVTSRRTRVDSSRDVKSVKFSTSPVFRTVDGHLSVRMVVFSKKKASDKVGSSDQEALAVDSENLSGFLAADERSETVVARYDYPLRAARISPFVASFAIAIAAGGAIYKPQNSFSATDLIAPAIVASMTLIGLLLGLVKKQ